MNRFVLLFYPISLRKMNYRFFLKFWLILNLLFPKNTSIFWVTVFLQKYNFEKKNLSLFVFSRDCGPKHTQVEIQTGMIIEMGAFEFFSFRSFIFVNNPFRSFFSIVQTLLISFHFLLQSFIKNSSFKRITRKPSWALFLGFFVRLLKGCFSIFLNDPSPSLVYCSQKCLFVLKMLFVHKNDVHL